MCRSAIPRSARSKKRLCTARVPCAGVPIGFVEALAVGSKRPAASASTPSRKSGFEGGPAGRPLMYIGYSEEAAPLRHITRTTMRWGCHTGVVSMPFAIQYFGSTWTFPQCGLTFCGAARESCTSRSHCTVARSLPRPLEAVAGEFNVFGNVAPMRVVGSGDLGLVHCGWLFNVVGLGPVC